MGDLEPAESTVYSLEADLETGGIFEHASMLYQSGVSVLVKLFEQLGFMNSGHPKWATTGLAHHMEGAKAVQFQISVHGRQLNRELVRRFQWRFATLDCCDNALPQCQIVPGRPDDFHSLL